VCVALVAALRRMPPATGLFSWPEHLPPIGGVTLPQWTPLDPAEHLDAIRAFMIERERKSNGTDERTDDAIWSGIGPSVESDIRTGKLLIGETTIRGAKLGWSDVPADRPWIIDVRFLRIGHIEPVHGTIGSPNQHASGGTFTDWAYTAVWFSLFPNVHNDLIDDGQGEHELILVAGQPWFVIGAALGAPYTNDLEEQTPAFVGHRLYMNQRCLIDFWQSAGRQGKR